MQHCSHHHHHCTTTGTNTCTFAACTPLLLDVLALKCAFRRVFSFIGAGRFPFASRRAALARHVTDLDYSNDVRPFLDCAPLSASLPACSVAPAWCSTFIEMRCDC